MSNYSNTKATIAANVYTNHNHEVTAAMVKTGINTVVDALIAGGYLWAGVAHPGDAASTPDANVVKVATEVGTYTNYKNSSNVALTVADGEVAVFTYNGSWSKEVTGAATAAEVSALGHEVDGLAINLPNAGTVPFHFEAGKTYIVQSRQATPTVNISTRTTPDGSAVDGPYSLVGNGQVKFTASAEAFYLRCSNTLNGVIFAEDSLYDKVNNRLATKEEVAAKVDIKPGKNLFDKDSPLLLDNSCFDASGNVVSDAYTTYWLISNPINVAGHRGEYIICNKSYNANTRYCCFVNADGTKTAVKASISAYQIPLSASIAYILIYKTGGAVNLDEVQIEFGQSVTTYEPYSPIAGYPDIFKPLEEETLFPPAQEDKHSTYTQIDSASIYADFDAAAAKFPSYITKTYLGKDASNTFDISGYSIAFTTAPMYKILFICNQHGGSTGGDQPMGAYLATRLLADICGQGHRYNPLLRWIRENVQVNIIPVANPWGVDNNSRQNSAGVDLNRNWPTSGWSASTATDKGASAGDQPEVQHCLTFINAVDPDIIIDNHTLGGVDGLSDANDGMMYVGFMKDYAENTDTGYSGYFGAIAALMLKEFGITLDYAHYATSGDMGLRAWAYENDYFGGLIEMQWRDPLDSDTGFTASIINASYMLAATLYQYYYGVYKK